MKKICLILLIIVVFNSQLYAQKYSLIVSDIIVPSGISLDSLKVTYSIREELATNDYFSVLSRNISNSMLMGNGNGNGNGISYSKKNKNRIDILRDILIANNVDFAFIAEIEEKSGSYILNASLLNHEGPIFYYTENIEPEEKNIEGALINIVKRINELLNLNENDNINPYEFDEMVYIPGGKAIIGSFNGDPDEAPQREVVIPGFYIDKYEVTNAQYERFVKATGRKQPVNVVNSEYTVWKDGTYPQELAYHPVVNVTWYDAKEYCEWVGKRLPTALEWEKAARGPYGNIYPWGNEYFDGYANLFMKGVSYEKQKTVPVGTYTKSKSYYGVYDLAGNVWEWTDTSAPTKDKNGRSLRKIAKGGGWGFNGNKYSARASYGLYFTPDYTSNCLGFRCAK